MRPERSTWVDSTTSKPAPEFASIPRCVMCQSFATPSSALYWHIGETTMRLARLRSASRNGEKSALSCPVISAAIAFLQWRNDAPLQPDPQKICQLADDAAPERQHADHENRALDHQHPLAEWRQIILHADDDKGADHRPEHGAKPAKQRHQQHVARHRPVHVGERGELEHQRLHRAGQPRERRRQDKGDELIALSAKPERHTARLVLAYGFENFAERRIDDAIDE